MAAAVKRRVALGGLGADAHSVGLIILRHALAGAGHDVHFMGTQNTLSAFFAVESHVDAVLVSCMDGHLRYYLKEFAELRRQAGPPGALWYAGGNLAVDNVDGITADAVSLGFSRVYPRYVDIPTVLSALAEDLSTRPRTAGRPPPPPVTPPRVHLPTGDERLSPSQFHGERADVLRHWETGWQARDLEDNARFLTRQPSFAAVQARRDGRPPLLQPRSGVALVDRQIAAFTGLVDAGADVLSYQVDSLTRNNLYAAAGEAVAESRELGRSTLNGFPMVNHGVAALREVASHIRRPLQTRHSTRDPRLLAEISCAGGVTGFEGGAICYNVPYFKDYPLAESVRRWQYVDRLVGRYADDHGVQIDREFFGTLTAVLVPPCLAIVVNLLEMVLAVNQGVRSVSLGYAEQGNRAQDVAAMRVLRDMAGKTLANLGHHGVRVNTVFHQYMAAFPLDLGRSRDLILASASTARAAGATRVLTKSPVEAIMIPTLADNRDGLALSRLGIQTQPDVPAADVDAEELLIRAEVEQIFDSVLMCGGGVVAQGVVRAFELGYLDIPFAPSGHNRGEVMTARDNRGAVRFLRTGRLQLSPEIRAAHRDKMDARRSAEPSRGDWELVERDVLQVPAGRYRRWPLDA